MPKAEGRRYEFQDASAIDTGALETLAYDGRDQKITIDTIEFSAVCPYSGLPDYGRIVIEYIPTDRIVELKALKYYLISFRNVGIYQEDATDRIYKDMTDLLSPSRLKVNLRYNTRGGIDVTCEMEDQA